MKIGAKFVWAVVALTVAGGVAQAQNEVKLRYKLQKGKTYIYRKTETMKQTQTIKDQVIKTDIKSTAVSTMSVQKVDAKGNLHLTTKNKQLKTTMTIGPVGTYTFDSKKDGNDKESELGAALTPLYERVSTASLKIVVEPDGTVQKVIGYKELLQGVLDNPIAQQFSGGASDDAAKFGIGENFPGLSKKAVQVGDQWERKFQLKLPKIGNVTGKRIYTYDGAGKVGKHKTAKISVATELSVDIKIDQGAAKITGNMSISDSKGTIHFDVEQGIVRSMTGQITLSGNLNVNVAGMDIPLAIEQTQGVSLELLSKLPK